MRLPSFIENAELNELRRRMGASSLGSLTLVLSPNRLTVVELETLMNGGIDIKSLDEVVVLPDGTLAYKDRRVLLYIRDVAIYGQRDSGPEALPKFHVSNCKKLQDMRSQQRYSRYVVAARDDGNFRLNLIRHGVSRTSDERLKVCQYCLSQLRYQDFSHTMPQTRRAAIVEEFTVQRFFQMWPRDIISADGLDGEATAPMNDYTGDFGQHALVVKNSANWCCRECKQNLGEPSMRKYLHAHHKNGVKYDNSPNNLVPLCISCHARQPGHGHMAGLPDLAEYRGQLK